jgi:indole-3-glycerol phosphate synthase
LKDEPVDFTGTEHLPNSKISRRVPEVQGSKRWVPPAGALGELLASTRVRIKSLGANRAEIESAAAAAVRAPSFMDALQAVTVSVIAEVKRSSPSKGEINPRLDVASQCRAYDEGGASAISVLTEPTKFGGDIADLVEARRATVRPLLRKDFIIDELQIIEARAAGASAVLLIVRALDPSKLKELFRATVENRLYALVEVRDENELGIALDIGATVIGVNNRNLETLKIDNAADSVVPRIPRRCVAVAESGYHSVDDVARAAAAGADAVLIGSALSASLRPAELLAQLTTFRRSRNARPN